MRSQALSNSQSQAHNVVESKEFHTMCLTLNYEAGHALVRSHSSIPRRIASNFGYQRSLVKEALHEAQSAIQLCTDSWTSGLSNQREFQAINAQWVVANGQIQRALLALPELTQGHAEDDVALHVIHVLQRYGIKHKLDFVTADNATASDTLCRAIERQLTLDGVTWNAATQRLRCFGHILNIATQVFMFAKDSDAVDVATQHTANTQSLSGKIISIPGQTRWNGWFMITCEAFETRPVVAQLIDRHPELEHHWITADDRHGLEATRDLLEPFWQVTLQTEGNGVTLDEMQTTIDFIIYHLQRSEEKYASDTGLLAVVNTCWYAFNKWYESIDEVPAYVTAVLLHP
ncbi:hypothetical protein Q7P37_003033 [Cladosporium fusiforme]